MPKPGLLALKPGAYGTGPHELTFHMHIPMPLFVLYLLTLGVYSGLVYSRARAAITYSHPYITTRTILTWTSQPWLKDILL